MAVLAGQPLDIGEEASGCRALMKSGFLGEKNLKRVSL